MAKVYTIHAEMAQPVTADNYRNSGSLYAFTFVDITDIFGHTRMRKVSLGRCHSVGLDTAREMVNKARDVNKASPINATFTLNL